MQSDFWLWVAAAVCFLFSAIYGFLPTAREPANAGVRFVRTMQWVALGLFFAVLTVLVP